ncbi:MAG: CBS domain-containing protein [Desulfuromonadales bacterium]|nr:CBS domain-containing protein [Desulfuromonadales bacterium]
MRSKVGRLASSPVISVDIECLVSEGLQLMCARSVSCLIVLSGGEPISILTERDVVFAANWMLGQADLRIGQVMNKQVMTINKGMTVQEVCEVFRGNSVRHLVVVDSRGQATGIFTRSDLVRIMEKSAFAGMSDVSGLMSAKVWHVEPETTARYALSIMARHAISGVVVVKGGKPIGIFTERDVVRMITSGSDLTNYPVGDVLTSPAVCIAVGTAPRQAIALMQNKSVRRLVVLDSLGEMVGILTKTDLSRSLACCEVSDKQPISEQVVEHRAVDQPEARI